MDPAVDPETDGSGVPMAKKISTGPSLVPVGSAGGAAGAGAGTVVMIKISSFWWTRGYSSWSPDTGSASSCSPSTVTCGASGSSSGAADDSSPVVWIPTWDPSGNTIHPIVVLEPFAR